jgi:polyhydroxybutyrate depolymerase
MKENRITITVLGFLFLSSLAGYAQTTIRERLRERIAERAQKQSATEEEFSTEDKKNTILADGIVRTYIVHLPVHYKQNEIYPLVFVLHGGTANAENAMRMSQMSPKADQERFIVVYPNGTGKFKDKFLHWNDGSQRSGDGTSEVDDISFFRQLISQLQRDYKIDSKRIYTTGLSSGAIMTYRLGVELSDKIAAIAPVSGALNYDKSVPAEPVSVIIFHGTADKYVPYNGGIGKSSGGQRQDKPVAYAVDFWVKHNGCNPVPVKTEQGNIIKEEYRGGTAGSEVILYTIKNGGHAWPGGISGARYGNVDEPTQEISATDIIWEFFKKHPKK